MRSQEAHPLDPLSAAEVAVAIATVRAAGESPEVSTAPSSLHFHSAYRRARSPVFKATDALLSLPQVRDGMRFIEVVLQEPDKSVVALADAYFFPPYQPTLIMPKSKGGAIIPLQLPPRQARLVVYNKRTNETSIWYVELTEVHAAARGGHHRGKVISSQVVPDVQPPMVRFSIALTSLLASFSSFPHHWTS